MPMSALGQKQTYASAKRHVRYGPKADISNFDHFIRLQQHRGRHSKAEGTRLLSFASARLS
jgi:hypothetical protein